MQAYEVLLPFLMEREDTCLPRETLSELLSQTEEEGFLESKLFLLRSSLRGAQRD